MEDSMSYNWIRSEDYSMDTFLLFDRWVIRDIMDENKWYNDRTRNYISDMAKALSRYPYVITFCKRKAPECIEFLNKIMRVNVSGISEVEAHNAETAILSAQEQDGLPLRQQACETCICK